MSAPTEERRQAPVAEIKPDQKWLRGPEVDRRYGLTRTTRHRLRKADPSFPKPAVLPTGSERWNIDLLDAYFAGLGRERGA